MPTYTITTTAEQEAALVWAYTESQKPVTAPGFPTSLPPAQTQAEYLQANVDHSVLNPMVVRYQEVRADDVVDLLATIPPANRPAALADLEDLVVAHGGTVQMHDVPYLWSTNTAAPPRNNSIEADATQPNIATITKLTVHYLDADAVDRMVELMKVANGSILTVDNPAVPSSALRVRVTAPPIQRQGANGYVEFPVQLVSFAGAFTDTQRLRFGVDV